MARLRGWICKSHSLLLRGPRSRKDISEVRVNKSLKGMCIANNNISSLVIDKLSSRINADRILVVYYYCNFQTEKSHVTAHMLVSLLKQVVGGLEVIPAEVGDAFKEADSNGRCLSIPEILELLAAALGSQKRTFICIDALDECTTENRPEFLRSLHFLVQNSPNIRLFVTGRPHIQAELEKHHHRALQIIVFKPAKGDITRYLEMKLEDDSFCEAMDNELKRDLIEGIPEMVSEMYVDEPVFSSPGY